VTVCQLLHTLNVGGAEVLAARLARRLRDQFRFLFVCLDELGTLGEQLREEGFPVEVVERRSGVDWRCPWRISRLLGRYNVDLVQAHQYTPFFYALCARMVYRRAPILFTEHGRHQPDYPRRKRILANRLLLGRRDRVVAVGEAVRQALIVNEGLPPGRVEVVYNGIDTCTFGRDEARREPVRRELGLDRDNFVILQVARLDYLKDHATAVHTMSRVVAKVPRARLVLVGQGPEETTIRTLVEREGLEDKVLFLGLRQDVARLLQAADVFLLTSISEGIPLTLIEAMAAGLPIVCTNVGGTSEVVGDGETGYLAPAKDEERLAACLAKLANDPGLRQHLGTAGQQRAREVFDEPQMAARYAEVYRGMLHG
jgi:glycosyltransferase involved in cell wall biosynthesis